MADGRDLPARLDRSALERVLARAAELQAGELDPGEQVSEDRLLEIANEVGLSPHHMRQALAEERTRVAPPEEVGPLARFAGAARVVATRVVNGVPSEALASLDAWMQNHPDSPPGAFRGRPLGVITSPAVFTEDHEHVLPDCDFHGRR